jgi:hypothetical protein
MSAHEVQGEMKEKDYTDPVLEEIWAIREKIAAEFDYDIQKMGSSTWSTRSSSATG